MTAEIGILNRTGVALAADSAVTIGAGGTQKVYNSANKLFALSKRHPVGIMVYGNAEFMGVPWETIIKEFREVIGDTKRNELIDYCNEFFDFLKSDPRFVSPLSESRLVLRIFNTYLTELLHSVNEDIYEKFHMQEPSEDEVEELIAEKVKDLLLRLNGIEFVEGFKEESIEEFITAHASVINKVVEHQINIPLKEETIQLIQEMAGNIFTKDFFSDATTGIVIAGFGESEIFPALYEYEVEGIFCRKLKKKDSSATLIGAEQGNGKTTSSVRAFAQKEMVDAFLRGVDPYLNNTMLDILSQVFDTFPSILENKLNMLFSAEQEAGIKEIGKSALEFFQEEIRKIQQEKYINPVLEIVDVLPKEELAAMAEALVNLTSFKRKVTIDAETVGGPIDVAVISKGDGFIWIKRKHYFKPELNYLFFQNYLRGGDNVD